MVKTEGSTARSTGREYTEEMQKHKGYLADLSANRTIYAMALPAVVFLLLFAYWPTLGVVLAFKNYSFAEGILGSPWVGLSNFREIFDSPFFVRAVRNSLIISFMKLLVGFPFPIIIALLLNEIKLRAVKKAVQTVTALPYFISWVVLGGIVISILSPSGGIINEVLVLLGKEPINFMVENRWFRWILVASDIWKNAGWGAIIYLAALAGIDPQQYESAMMDGANRWKQLIHITLPGLTGTIAVLLILNMGWILSAGFEQVYLLYNAAVYDSADIIETYLLRTGLSEGRFDLATAIGLFQSVVGCIMLFTVNGIVRRMGKSGVF